VVNTLEDLENLMSFKAFVSGWMLRRLSREQPGDSSTWESQGNIPWIVGVRGVSEDRTQVLLAFHGPDVLNVVIDEAGLAETFPGACRIIASPNGEGFSPGGSFQGFRLQFEVTDVSAWTKSSLPFPILY
jgi:hypothetical protein